MHAGYRSVRVIYRLKIGQSLPRNEIGLQQARAETRGLAPSSRGKLYNARLWITNGQTGGEFHGLKELCVELGGWRVEELQVATIEGDEVLGDRAPFGFVGVQETGGGGMALED
jgi:hypothetical protein